MVGGLDEHDAIPRKAAKEAHSGVTPPVREAQENRGGEQAMEPPEPATRPGLSAQVTLCGGESALTSCRRRAVAACTHPVVRYWIIACAARQGRVVV